MENLLQVVDIAGSTIAVNTTAYGDNDLVGTKLTIDGVLGPQGMILVGVVLHDLTAQAAALDLVLFDANPSATTFTNNGALDIADADITKVAWIVPIAATDYTTFADNAVAHVEGLVMPIRPVNGKTIYACLRSNSATPTYDASAVSLKLLFLE